MRKSLWTKDENEVKELIKELIQKRIPLTLQGRDQTRYHTLIIRAVDYNGSILLLLMRPESLKEPRVVATAIFKAKGLPILGFPCPIIKKSQKLVATILPMAVHQHDLRAHPRLPVPEGSLIIFKKDIEEPKPNVCLIKDLSMGGAKLIGTPFSLIAKNDVVGPCNVTITGAEQQVISELDVHRASVVRVLPLSPNGDRMEIGLKFDLTDQEENAMEEQFSIMTKHLM